MSLLPRSSAPLQMITTLPAERSIINRERAAQSYRVSAYYLSKIFTELPFRAAAVFLFAAVTYWPVQLQRDAAKYFLFIVICLLEFIAMNAVGVVVSIVADVHRRIHAKLALLTGNISLPLFSLR